MTGPSRRAFRPAVVGPLAAVLILRHAGQALAEKAALYETHVSPDSQRAGEELRAALAQMQDAEAEWQARRAADVSETTKARSQPRSAESGLVLTVGDTASRLGVSEQRVRELARDPSSGLDGDRLATRGRPWQFALADVEAFEASKEQRG